MTNFLICLIMITAASTCVDADTTAIQVDTDTIVEPVSIQPDSVKDKDFIRRLTDDDYREAANRLGVEIAVIKAVVQIEAGSSHTGFHAPEKPIINFDLTMFRKAATKRGIKLTQYQKSHPEVFSRPSIKKYGSLQAARHARLKSAMSIDSIAAIDGTFWGMFQIGGFNWKKCGTASREEFVKRMSLSEHEQLNLFVNFVINSGMDRFLRKKDWAGFARRYNGASYRKRRYHTRLAKAYKSFLKAQNDKI